MKIAIVDYPGVSAFELSGVYEPLRRLAADGPVPGFSVDLCAYSDAGQAQPAARRMQTLAGYDLVVIPGSSASAGLPIDPAISAWLASAAGTPVLAACGAALGLLAAAGLLAGQTVAAQPDLPAGLKPVDQRLVLDGGLLTCAGGSAALDLGLYLCRRAAGDAAASEVRAALLYPHAWVSPYVPAAANPGDRFGAVTRRTAETDISVKVNLDGKGACQVHTGLPFFDHMLTQIAIHGLFDLDLSAAGDLHIDPHHTVEDVALALGEAFRSALGSRAGIVRMASFDTPMDESLARVVVDFSGRPYAVIRAEWAAAEIGGIPASLFTHFLESFAQQARCNLHVQVLYGSDGHHQVEAVFKALSRALCAATRPDPRRGGAVPSSKGVLM
jgi:imidazoleglycerol-phosphate dehydratase